MEKDVELRCAAIVAFVFSFSLQGQLATQGADNRAQLERAEKSRLEQERQLELNRIERDRHTNSLIPVPGRSWARTSPVPIARESERLDQQTGGTSPPRSTGGWPGEHYRPEIPRVQLQRGSEVLDVSTDALVRSGLFNAAIEASDDLSWRLHELQMADLGKRQLDFEYAKADTAAIQDQKAAARAAADNNPGIWKWNAQAVSSRRLAEEIKRRRDAATQAVQRAR